MFTTHVKTVRVPQITGAPVASGGIAIEPLPIVQQAKVNCGVKIRNLSFGAFVLVAFDVAAITSFPASDAWQIPAGQVDEFIVAAGQSLVVASPAGAPDVMISYQIFQAFPTTTATNGASVVG
jgi:hypothetical protein